MHKGGVILKSKYKIIRFICVISSIILAICFFIGNIESKKLMPYIILNLMIYQFSNYKENKPFKNIENMMK